MTKNKEKSPVKSPPVESSKKVDPKKVDQQSQSQTKSQSQAQSQSSDQVKLSGLYAFKLKMSSLYDEEGQWTAVTFLKYRPWVVSQIKTKNKDGYNSVQLACVPQKNSRCSKALSTHLRPAGFKQGAMYVREIRQQSVDNISIGQKLSIHSLKKGDVVTLRGVSKGHGFSGVVKRWGFKGGPASHGAKTHRTSGSIGNRTEPGRVQPGKKMAGRMGWDKISCPNVKVVDVIEDQQMLIVKGCVPGATNSLVYLNKATQQKETTTL